MSCVALQNISMEYEVKEGLFTALRDVNIDIQEGEFVSILGQTGCGKSTLLKLISGILQPSRGTIRIRDKSLQEAKNDRSFGFVFQDPVLLPWQSALQNVMLPLEVVNYPKDQREPRARQLLEWVGLRDFAGYRPWEMSGGMRQRVSIARALAFDPPIILMDEPFSALDESTRASLHADLLRLWEQGKKTIVFVTHSISEAVYLSDRVVVMGARPGRVKHIVDIDLPRPRSIELTEHPEYLSYVRFLRGMLEEQREA